MPNIAIPTDTLPLICSFLRKEDVFRIGQVCSEWRTISSTNLVWQKLYPSKKDARATFINNNLMIKSYVDNVAAMSSIEVNTQKLYTYFKIVISISVTATSMYLLFLFPAILHGDKLPDHFPYVVLTICCGSYGVLALISILHRFVYFRACKQCLLELEYICSISKIGASSLLSHKKRYARMESTRHFYDWFLLATIWVPVAAISLAKCDTSFLVRMYTSKI